MQPYVDSRHFRRALLPRRLPEWAQSIMNPPIRAGELDWHYFGSALPGDIYHTEAELEELRLWPVRQDGGVEGPRRMGVLVRHRIKRRWQQLGVWNFEWGFPRREVQPTDDAASWKWPWQQDGAGSSEHRELLARALQLRLRQNLHRGESCTSIPRSRLGDDATTSEAESFIISRPWFIFEIEVAEERARYQRLSSEDRHNYPHSARMQVAKWWKERGDWRDEFNQTNKVTSWKWRHESPSPEPESLDPVRNMTRTSFDGTNIDFTPSEIDDLETIKLPPHEQPPHFWAIPNGCQQRRTFPGQMLDRTPRSAAEALARRICNLPSDYPISGLSQSLSDPQTTRTHHDPSQKLSRPRQDTTSSLPQDSQSSNQHPPRVEVEKAQNEDYRSRPRRSEWIKNQKLKRPAEPHPSQPAPGYKRKSRATQKVPAPAIQHTTRKPSRKQAEPVQISPSGKALPGPGILRRTRASTRSAVPKASADTGEPKAKRVKRVTWESWKEGPGSAGGSSPATNT